MISILWILWIFDDHLVFEIVFSTISEHVLKMLIINWSIMAITCKCWFSETPSMEGIGVVIAGTAAI